MPTALAAISWDIWQAEVGDPTQFGWTIACAYGLTSLLCGRRVILLLTHAPGARRLQALMLWFALATMLLGLGLNKQLDLQTALTRFGRILASEQGWYEQRRLVQALVLGAAAVVTLGGTGWILWRARDASARARCSLVGAAALMVFVITRAVSFHHVDQVLGLDLAGTKLHLVIEVAGIVLIALAAGWRLPTSSSIQHLQTEPAI